MLCIIITRMRDITHFTDTSSHVHFYYYIIFNTDGVGKSSLVSTYVSRHFSDSVPSVLTKVRLPPTDAASSKCCTTIIDTKGGDVVLSDAFSLLNETHTDNKDGFVFAVSSTGKPHNMPTTSTDTSSPMGEKKQDTITTPSAALDWATLSPYRCVDAIILVYDLDRIESFHRLHVHWLPLIERCYGTELPVIVAGNKMDLTATELSGSGSSNQELTSPSREQIIALLQRFKFVRQCIKCSAKRLRNVDEVFSKSRQSVLYPISPLYDLSAGKLTPASTRAFTRIFRMFDKDQDGLLSDDELNAFQQKIWGTSLLEKDITGWKEMVTQHESSGVVEKEVIRDGKFTIAGFMTMFDVLITSQNRLEVPWKVLRALGFDDDLNLILPESLSVPKHCDLEYPYLSPSCWRLTKSDIEFLTSIFVQFDSDGDGFLSSTDIHSIFSVLPSPTPPWCKKRGSSLFRNCFSVPQTGNEMTPSSSPGEPIDGMSSHPSSPSSIVSEGGVTISSSPLPSVDTSKDTESLYFHDFTGSSLSYLSWMNRWHMICTISPTIARAEMYKIGHSIEQDPPRFSLMPSKFGEVTTNRIPFITKSPSTIVRAIVLGSKDSGKRGLIHKLHRWHSPSGNKKSESDFITTSSSVSKVVVKDEQTTVHLILTEVPAIDLSSDSERINLRNHLVTLLSRAKSGARPYDLIILAFDVTSIQSLDYAIDLERFVLTDNMPRVFVGTTIDESAKASHPFREAVRHCSYMELGPPILVSLDVDTKLDSSVLERFVSCTLDVRQVGVSFRSTPHSEKKRRAAKRCKILWIGGIVTAGITFILGFTIGGGNKKMSSSAYAACGVTVFRGASAAIMRRFTV